MIKPISLISAAFLLFVTNVHSVSDDVASHYSPKSSSHMGYKLRVVMQIFLNPFENLERLVATVGRNSNKKVICYVKSVFKAPNERLKLMRGAASSSIFSLFWYGRLKLYRDFHDQFKIISENCYNWTLATFMQSCTLSIYDAMTRLPADFIRTKMIDNNSMRYKDFLSIRPKKFSPQPAIFILSSIYAWYVFIFSAHKLKDYLTLDDWPNASLLLQGCITGLTSSAASTPVVFLMQNMVHENAAQAKRWDMKQTVRLFGSKKTWNFMRFTFCNNLFCRSIAAMATFWASSY